MSAPATHNTDVVDRRDRDTYATAFVLWVSLMILIRTIGVGARGYRIGAKVGFSEFRRRHERVLGRPSV